MDLTPLHRQHRALAAMIHANGRVNAGRVTRIILDDLDDQARKLLRRIEADIRDAKAGFDTRLSLSAIHGGEAAARDLIRRSEHHRSRAVQPIPSLALIAIRAARLTKAKA